MNQRRLGKYELQERLGHDAVGGTWKAFDTQFRRSVAIKLIAVNPEAGSEFFEQFSREGQAVAALHHPNIVPLQEFAVEPEQGEAYIVTDYIEGLSLDEYLSATARQGTPTLPTELVRLLVPIASALDYAHQRGFVHGALKPTAILLDKRFEPPGEPMLINFGVRQKQDPRLLSPEDAAYIAPEIAQGYAATSRSDLYSLGIILYELCTGALPFHGETASDILMQHIHNVPTSPALINPQIRPALTSVIMRCLARDPAGRFSSAAGLVSAVAKAVNISLPESKSYSNPALGVINPPSFSGISDANSPTYLIPSSPSPSSPSVPLMPSSPSVPLYPLPSPSSPSVQVTPSSPSVPFPSSPSVPIQPVVPGGNVPTMPPLTQVSQSSPGFPAMQTGAFPQMQPLGNMMAPMPQQISGMYPVIGVSGPMPVTPPISPSSRLEDRPPASRPAFANSTGKRRLAGLVLLALAIILIVILIGSVVLSYFTTPSVPPTTIVGNAFFVSSGLISNESNQGITDAFHIALQNIDSPQPGKHYYGWLIGSNVPALALGALTVDNKQITTTYTDPNHNNLLANYSRFLITEEDANQQPTNPAFDTAVWRYISAFSTAPNPADEEKHYSLLDHLRHLLSQDPKLQGAGLSGGLSKWLYRNTTKILEAAGSARDTQKHCIEHRDEACDTYFILRQVARILDYLAGSTYVQRVNIPSYIQQPDSLLIDSNVARVALLEFDAVKQDPPGYLKHIGGHLQKLVQISDTTPGQRSLASSINLSINNVQGWLDDVYLDAVKIIHMDNNQLLQPEAQSTLNDLFKQANAAFVGQVDPNTGNEKEGVVHIYYDIQKLATFDVAPCTTDKNGQRSCGGNKV
jgi:eukaryotic-like serine/threonine-protein kinase